ncbi:MAG: hypothetical protein R3C26_00325 [Calditrichia bacterium]
MLDSGDALLSYPLPEANRTMLQLLSIAKYDALNIGDQEFVESADFIFRENRCAATGFTASAEIWIGNPVKTHNCPASLKRT